MTGIDAAPDPHPSAQRLELTEQLHGRTVADPYRWLEDPADARVITWATEQDRLTRKVLDALADPARAPVLIRREVEVGHASRAVSRTVALTTDQLCFLAHYNRLDLEAVHTR